MALPGNPADDEPVFMDESTIIALVVPVINDWAAIATVDVPVALDQAPSNGLFV